MKIFVPKVKDEKQSEEYYNGIVKYNKDIVGEVSGRKIYSLTYKHNNKKYTAVVGENDEIENEPIIAILESRTFLICTPNRGVIRGTPILVGHDEIISVEDFEK